MTAVGSDRRSRILAELGLVRYRLRPGPDAGAGPGTRDRRESSSAPAAAPARLPLQLSAPGMAGALPGGPAAIVWSQILAWLQLPEQAVAWVADDDPAAVALPAPALWLRPEGKQALWQALKPFRSGRR